MHSYFKNFLETFPPEEDLYHDALRYLNRRILLGVNIYVVSGLRK